MDETEIAERRAQVAAQCKLVAHMAEAIATVHRDYQEMFEAGACDALIGQVGRRTASLMEDLGDALNGMDAVTEEDAWGDPIFEGARRHGFSPPLPTT